jgi:hypothetical protein
VTATEDASGVREIRSVDGPPRSEQLERRELAEAHRRQDAVPEREDLEPDRVELDGLEYARAAHCRPRLVDGLDRFGAKRRASASSAAV